MHKCTEQSYDGNECEKESIKVLLENSKQPVIKLIATINVTHSQSYSLASDASDYYTAVHAAKLLIGRYQLYWRQMHVYIVAD